MQAFFQAVSFEPGDVPAYEKIADIFIDAGLLIKNIAVPEVASVAGFIAPRRAAVQSGQLTCFSETEVSESTDIFGNVAQRLSVYSKSGMQNGECFDAKGVICTQFVRTPVGWRISSMAWDDERPGLKAPSGNAANDCRMAEDQNGSACVPLTTGDGRP
jgi:hypothetical protein